MKKHLLLALTVAAPIAFLQAPAVQAATQDPLAAAPGPYNLDPRHTTVGARVKHAGISFSTYRFGTTSGTLTWNGASPESSSLSVTVDMTSIMTPVANFANELIGDRFLKTASFHDATFVSTAITRSGPTAGRITGNLTFMGVTKPVTIDAALVGVGKSMKGADAIGFTGTMRIKRSDFGFTAMSAIIADDVDILLDVEFDKAA